MAVKNVRQQWSRSYHAQARSPEKAKDADIFSAHKSFSSWPQNPRKYETIEGILYNLIIDTVFRFSNDYSAYLKSIESKCVMVPCWGVFLYTWSKSMRDSLDLWAKEFWLVTDLAEIKETQEMLDSVRAITIVSDVEIIAHGPKSMKAYAR